MGRVDYGPQAFFSSREEREEKARVIAARAGEIRASRGEKTDFTVAESVAFAWADRSVDAAAISVANYDKTGLT